MTTHGSVPAGMGEARKRHRLTDMGRQHLAMESAIDMAIEALDEDCGIEVMSLIRKQERVLNILREGLAPADAREIHGDSRS